MREGEPQCDSGEKLDEALGDPDVRFFAERNPGHDEGDLLVVSAPLTLGNRIAVARGLLRCIRRRR